MFPLLVLMIIQLGQTNSYDDMEPVLEVELNEDIIDQEEARREAIKYVQDNYKDIEKKMKAHEKSENTSRA